jgi:chemotaxis signal transduction protein
VSAPEAERLLLFELAGHVYGLPIGGILEVVEAGERCGVPTLPAALAGVLNWHGEALPIVAPQVLIEETGALRAALPAAQDDAAPLQAEQVLVLSDRGDEVPKLGLPIDSVLGLVDAASRSHAGAGSAVVRERRSIDGRLVTVLDPRRLVARARGVIEETAA